MPDEPRVAFEFVSADEDGGDTFGLTDLTADVREVALDEVERVAKRLHPGDAEAVSKAADVERERIEVERERNRLEDARLFNERRAIQALETSVAVEKVRLERPPADDPWYSSCNTCFEEFSAPTRKALDILERRHDRVRCTAPGQTAPVPRPEPVRHVARVVPRPKTKPAETPIQKLRRLAKVREPEPTPIASLASIQKKARIG